MTVKVHQDDHIFPPPSPIPGSYNPPSGIAYYFSLTGEQLHSIPNFQVNKTSTKKNFDDNPLIDGQCNKKYPSVSYGGYGYMFICFCPIHGHTYGFHLIDGVEGKKDPFASLFKYKEQMPDHIFCDFACSLSEYCLNRAPSLFSNTCFWHDLFPSVGHLCGDNFKSMYVNGLEGLNTEICESGQFIFLVHKIYRSSPLTRKVHVLHTVCSLPPEQKQDKEVQPECKCSNCFTIVNMCNCKSVEM